jgi:Ca2+-transporting ATPase
MDTLAGLAFAGEPPLDEYMSEPPKRRGEPVLNRYMLHQILCTGLFTVILLVLFLKVPHMRLLFRYSGDNRYFMTAFFALFIFAGVFNSFNARTYRLNLLAHIKKNVSFIFIMTMVSVVQLLMIYYGGSLFRTAGLTFAELRTVFMIAFIVIPADCIRKLVLRLFGRKGTL